MSNTVIEFENVSKQYRLGTIGTGTLTHDINRWWHLVRGKEDPYLQVGQVNDRSVKSTSDYVWALKDITFNVKQGEVVGIIGKNGAGKSTLLKILSRVTSPTTGSIRAKGRIASLLEVGTGFHGELTGRENIYMNGAILGMTKREITNKFDEIVDFSGIAKYVDTPVKRYSSGMTVRLGFAIAAHLEPEILVVDEVLAVGDAEFQKKAIGKMKDVSQGGGRTVLFVSHQLNSVAALCDKCVLMKDGTVNDIGGTSDIISKYLSFDEKPQISTWINKGDKYNNEFCTLTEISIVNENGDYVNQSVFANNQVFYVKIEFEVETLHSALCVGFAVYDTRDQLLFWSYNTDVSEDRIIPIQKGRNTFYAEFPKRVLNNGEYYIKPLISLHFISWIINPDSEVPSLHFTIMGGLSDSIIWNDKRPGILAPILEYKKQI
uniref:ABC transporter ATP-binding protein n=1 Tax=uncultured Dysgonomonas sp. TaxID=206096 RepID=UPI002629C287|nr:ABC transporter ATP-binding protein [uncultured Dysgonomonas sp.]